MATKRFKFKKLAEGEPASCWYCGSDTLFALYDLKDNSEIWCCCICANEIQEVLHIKKMENSVSSGGME